MCLPRLTWKYIRDPLPFEIMTRAVDLSGANQEKTEPFWNNQTTSSWQHQPSWSHCCQVLVWRHRSAPLSRENFLPAASFSWFPDPNHPRSRFDSNIRFGGVYKTPSNQAHLLGRTNQSGAKLKWHLNHGHSSMHLTSSHYFVGHVLSQVMPGSDWKTLVA